MESSSSLVDFAPLLRLALLAAVVALLPLSWIWLRRRGHDSRARLAALAALTLFLTFDLVVFGSFTRLTDSGLGCPDWPGCYGEASPLGARADIHAAQTALPGGPVTWHKAWIEMIHRYLAMTVGVLILVMAVVAWQLAWQAARQRRRRQGRGRPSHGAGDGGRHGDRKGDREGSPNGSVLPFSAWWPTLTLVWVVVQGLFGKYTVTLKLYPAIVTLHLLGGLLLLVLLAVQRERFRPQPLALPSALRRGAWLAMGLLWVQIALGGWVSTNYAVLACTGFPQCNGDWWPAMDAASGFTLLRELGLAGHGGVLPFDALVAIHMAHRLFAVVAALALALLARRLWRAPQPALRRFGIGLGLLLLAQLATGLSNVVLGWPLAAALLHSAGAAALVLTLTLLLARSGAPLAAPLAAPLGAPMVGAPMAGADAPAT